MEKYFRFTIKKLAALGCPKGKSREYFRDTMRPELFLQVTKKGTKTYYCRAWHAGKGYTANKLIGKFEQIDIVEARRRARHIASLLADGRDPDAERKARQRQEMTFALAFDSFLASPSSRRKKEERREATVAGYKHLYKRHLADSVGSRKLSSISAEYIDGLHTRIGEHRGKYAANRTIKLISGVYNDAIRKGWSGTNPSASIAPYPETSRKRFLREEELSPFISSCFDERKEGSASIADACLLALFTGLRRGNVCSASWGDIDLKSRTWRLHSSKMKNGEEHTVYLSDFVLRILAERRATDPESVWVLPSTGGTGHLVEPKKGLLRILDRAGISPEGVSMHALRHTFLTYADDAGLPSAVRKRLAAHRGRGDVTEGYTHALESRVREAYVKVAEHMLNIAKSSGHGSCLHTAV